MRRKGFSFKEAARTIYTERCYESDQNFRDNILSKTPQGRAIITLYYNWSPAMVKAMKEASVLKEEVKKSLDGALLMLR